ncbi:MAG: MogA/MoaB family molybdenum cofactor biosynthesis protein [Acidimicrobiia bacterium]
MITVSDGVHAGTREDLSGQALAALLAGNGFEVATAVVPDEQSAIVSALHDASHAARLIVTTGGTGFGPRDVTPEATDLVLEREAPGLTHLMLQAGLKSTKMAALSRARAGCLGTSLIVNVPGSTRGAIESIEAIIDVIPHALDLLEGNTQHG